MTCSPLDSVRISYAGNFTSRDGSGRGGGSAGQLAGDCAESAPVNATTPNSRLPTPNPNRCLPRLRELIQQQTVGVGSFIELNPAVPSARCEGRPGCSP